MTRQLPFWRKGLIATVACGLAMIAFAGQTTRAGTIQIVIHEAATGGDVTVNLGSGLEGPGTDMNHVTADVLALNSTLDALGYDFNFNALGAVANSPGAGGGSLNLIGLVFRTTAAGGDKTIQIDASQNGYVTLASLPGSMNNFITANFDNAPGSNSQTGTSYFNTSNGLDDTTGALNTAPLVFNPPGGSGGAPSFSVPSTPVFSLTDRISITLSADTSGGPTPPSDLFTHRTAIGTGAVPEPMSVMLMGTGIPLVLVGVAWLRRRRPAVQS